MGLAPDTGLPVAVEVALLRASLDLQKCFGNPATKRGIPHPVAMFAETLTLRYLVFAFLLPRSDRSVQISVHNDILLPGFTNFWSYLLQY
jgi:hypothetical protein